MKRICLASTVDDGSLYYRAILPARHLNPILREEGISLHVPVTGDDIRGYDAYVFYRQIDPKLFPFVIRMSAAGVPFAFDIDDNVFQIPKWSPAVNTFQPWFLDSLSLFMSIADRVTVSTDRLRDCGQFAPGVVEKTTVLPNLIDTDESPKPEPRPDSAPVRIMWAGYANHCGDLPHVFPALRAVKERWGEKVEVIFAGYCPKELVADPVVKPLVLGSVIRHHYARFLSFCRPTIGIAPLSMDRDDVPFNVCKSPIKWMEYTLAGAEVVAQAMSPYADVIDGSGMRGTLRATEDQWSLGLSNLVSCRINGNERRDRVSNARQWIFDHHSWQSPARERWLNFYRSLVA